MLDDNTPFALARKAYVLRLGAASICVAAASASCELLTSGAAGTHWLFALGVFCMAGALGAVLAWDTTLRWHHLRRLRPIEEAPKAYGFAGPSTTAAEDLKRTRASKPKSPKPPRSVH